MKTMKIAVLLLGIVAGAAGVQLPSAWDAGGPPRALGRVVGRLLKHILGRRAPRTRSRGNATKLRRRTTKLIIPNVPIVVQGPVDKSCWAYARATALYATGALEHCMPLIHKARWVLDWNTETVGAIMEEVIENCGTNRLAWEDLLHMHSKPDERDIEEVAERIYKAHGSKGGSFVSSGGTDGWSPTSWPLEQAQFTFHGRPEVCKLKHEIRAGRLVTMGLLSDEICDLQHFVTIFGMEDDGIAETACTWDTAKEVTFYANDPYCPEGLSSKVSPQVFKQQMEALGKCKTKINSYELLQREPRLGEQPDCKFPTGKTAYDIRSHPCVRKVKFPMGTIQDTGTETKNCPKPESNDLHKTVNNWIQSKESLLQVTNLRFNGLTTNEPAVVYQYWAFPPAEKVKGYCKAALRKKYKDEQCIAPGGAEIGKPRSVMDGVDKEFIEMDTPKSLKAAREAAQLKEEADKANHDRNVDSKQAHYGKVDYVAPEGKYIKRKDKPVDVSGIKSKLDMGKRVCVNIKKKKKKKKKEEKEDPSLDTSLDKSFLPSIAGQEEDDTGEDDDDLTQCKLENIKLPEIIKA